jgi:hypothetical protein
MRKSNAIKLLDFIKIKLPSGIRLLMVLRILMFRRLPDLPLVNAI